MAPYVMKVGLDNLTEYKTVFIGKSTLSDLDGKTEVKGIPEEVLSGDSMTGEIVKSDGTDGLFTTLSWYVAHVHDNVRCQFSLYSEMPAAWGPQPFVGLRNIGGMSWTQFTTSSAANDMRSSRYSEHNDLHTQIGDNGITVYVEKVKMEFPNSHVHITIRQEFDPAQMASKMGTFEGRRVRDANGCTYLVLGKVARPIANMSIYEGLFGPELKWWSFWDQDQVNGMPKGPAITANPPLVKPPGGGPIYFIEDSKKRWIQDPNTFNHYKFDWGRVAEVDVGKYEDGPPIKI